MSRTGYGEAALLRHRSGVLAAVVMLSAGSLQPVAADEADFLGEWTIVSVSPSPWGAPLGDVQAFVGARIAFRPEAMEGRPPFGCANAHYEIASLPPQQLFQGALDPDAAPAEARRLSIATPAETLMASCDTGAFDFHQTEDGLVTALDNAILDLERVAP